LFPISGDECEPSAGLSQGKSHGFAESFARASDQGGSSCK
jgi:hypothetical protein